MADIVTRVYQNFRGCDFRGEEINLVRSPDCLNVWKDYKETESIRTRPGMSLFVGFNAPVYGVFFYEGECICHSGTKLYRVENGVGKAIYSGLKPAKSQSFVFDKKLYIKDGANYLVYDGLLVRDVVGYVPTTTIGRKPSGGGSTYEDVNLLSDRRKNTFLADGESKEYFLDARNIDDSFKPVIRVNDKAVSNFTVDYAAGKITFANAPTKPLTDGQDNVVVEFQKTVSGYREKILNCTLLQVFDNRVFFSGNKDYPNTLWHSSLEDPSYCSDLDYYNEGQDAAEIRGMVAGNNALWVFKAPSDENTSIYYHTPTIDSAYGKIYPNTHSNISAGCVGRAINFNDDIVFFSDRGMEGISGDITTEQAISHRSIMVDRKLTAEADYKDMTLEEWDGYLFVFVDDKAYLADSRAMFANENHSEYEWFYWELGKIVSCAKVEDGVLYVGTEDGVYTFTDKDGDVESYWVTAKDKFNFPNKQKTTNKRGCVAEASGDVSVYAKTDGGDFELIGNYENINDYFVSRIKMKKFKDLQLKFYSQSRFSLETVSLECFIGGYIKR